MSCAKLAYISYGHLLVSGDPNSMKHGEIDQTNRRLEILCQTSMPKLAVLRDAPSRASSSAPRGGWIRPVRWTGGGRQT